MVLIHAVKRGGNWNNPIIVRGRAFDSACRTAARKLGLSGPILTTQRVGSSQFEVNVDGQPMMVVQVQS